MAYPEKYIRFDWAAKRMLRDKANFDVLEGLITVLLNEKITITQILESEGNQERWDDKFNRVDIKALNSKGEIIIVEIQLNRQRNFLRRILYGASKAVTEHLFLGETYGEVKKVYSINILYFDLGEGSDYLYHGRTVFEGVHTHDHLKLNERDGAAIRGGAPEDIFPEYYLIRVNQFNDVATTPLEEWIDYLKNNNIRDDTQAPGLQSARKKMLYIQMSEAERQAYFRHFDNAVQDDDEVVTARLDGLEEGHKAEKLAIARNMKAMGLADSVIHAATQLPLSDISNL